MFGIFGKKKKFTEPFVEAQLSKRNFQSGNKTVLVCDDAEFMRLILKDILYRCNYKTIEASDGQEAVELFFKHKPDLVLMDITMPNKDGITALREIMQKKKDAYIIMISAMGQQEATIEAIQSGAKSFIIKPFIEDRVLEALAEFDTILKASLYPAISQTEVNYQEERNEQKAVQTHLQILTSQLLFDTIKTMPLMFGFSTANVPANANINGFCANLVNLDIVSQAMSDEEIRQCEYNISSKRQRNSNPALYNRSMENNILYELFQYSYLMSVFEVLHGQTSSNINVKFDNFLSLVQNDCKTRIQNLNQEIQRTPSIKKMLENYATNTSSYPMPINSVINQRENDYIIACLMNYSLSYIIEYIFKSNLQKNLQTLNSFSAKEVMQTLNDCIVYKATLRLQLYAGDKII